MKRRADDDRPEVLERLVIETCHLLEGISVDLAGQIPVLLRIIAAALFVHDGIGATDGTAEQDLRDCDFRLHVFFWQCIARTKQRYAGLSRCRFRLRS